MYWKLFHSDIKLIIYYKNTNFPIKFVHFLKRYTYITVENNRYKAYQK